MRQLRCRESCIGIKNSHRRILPGCGFSRALVFGISWNSGTAMQCNELSLQSMEDCMVAPIAIKEHMEVVGSDGVHVGTVDHLEGRDTVKLTKDDPDAGGEHHYIPLAWIDHVEMKVHLKQSAAEAKARWKSAH